MAEKSVMVTSRMSSENCAADELQAELMERQPKRSAYVRTPVQAHGGGGGWAWTG
jgi:hypothetical protein